jgi:Tfp pilus assembly major pilin PilA
MKFSFLFFTGRKSLTLIELLITILIIVSLSAIAIPRFRNTFENAAFNSFVKEIYYLCQYLKEAAAATGKVYRLSITESDTLQFQPFCQKDSFSQEWVSPQGSLGRIYKAPKGIKISSLSPEEQRDIYFYPDASSSVLTLVLKNSLGKEISLVFKGASGVIQINPK